MKKLLFSSLIAGSLLTGCSAVYQSGQTPDDVYFSPGREAAAEVRRNRDDEERYQEYVTTMDDRYLRMRVANRDRWNTIDNFNYWNDMRYDFSPNNYNTFNNSFGRNTWGLQLNPWNIGWGNGYGLNAWNNWYGGIGSGWNNGFGNQLGWGCPIYSVITYANPKAIPATYTSGSNLNAFRNRTYNNSNFGGKGNDWYTPGNSGSNNNFGNLVKRVFSAPSSSNDKQGSSFDRPARTFSNSSSTPATSSSAGGSSGGVKSTGTSSSTGRGGRN